MLRKCKKTVKFKICSDRLLTLTELCAIIIKPHAFGMAKLCPFEHTPNAASFY